MGKTPKEKHRNERRRPYNYPRNAQAQSQNSGTESRNYSYPSGNVPRRRIPAYYQQQYQGIPVPVLNQPYHFGVGRGYRLRGGNKPFRPSVSQKRQDPYSKKVKSPFKRNQKTMQSQSSEKQELLQEKIEETTHQGDIAGVDQVMKNGPEKCSSHDGNLKDNVVGKLENGTPEVGEENSEAYERNNITAKSTTTPDDTGKTKSKSKQSKEKKVKKSSTPSKGSPKGKSPKSKKETKADIKEETENEKKEKEILEDKKELESKSCESTVASELQPEVKITRLTTSVTEISEVNDSVIEVPVEVHNEVNEIPPSTSTEEVSSKLLDAPSVKDSPRRSTRLTALQFSPKQRSPTKPDSSSIIVLDSDDSITVLEVNRTANKSFAQTLRSMSGRPSLRPLPAYNRPFNKPSTLGSASIHSNISSRSTTTTGNDSESETQEAKILRPKTGLWGLFSSSSKNATSQDSATDNEESTNRSIADDSGNDSEETSEPPFEAASNISFGKRKIRNDESVEEIEQENKRARGEEDGQKNSTSTSGLFSIMSSPINLFANKIRGDRVKSSTPVKLLKGSVMDEDEKEDFVMYQDSVSEIRYEDDNAGDVSEEDVPELSTKVNEGQPIAERRWCSIM